MEIRKDLLNKIKNITERLRLIQEDPEIREEFKKLIEREIDFYAFLLALEAEKTPIEGIKFGEKVEKKLKIPWRNWIKNVFKKLNSVIAKLIPIP